MKTQKDETVKSIR